MSVKNCSNFYSERVLVYSIFVTETYFGKWQTSLGFGAASQALLVGENCDQGRTPSHLHQTTGVAMVDLGLAEKTRSSAIKHDRKGFYPLKKSTVYWGKIYLR